MTMQPSESDIKARQHADHPEPGDYWAERLCPHYLVYYFDPIRDEVRYFDKVIRVTDGWYWDTGSRPRKSRAEFEKLLHYSSPNYLGNDIFLCDVIPNAMKPYVEEGQQIDAEEAKMTLSPTLAFC